MGPLAHSRAALLALAGLPAGLLALALRPAWREGLDERLGARPAAPPGAVWIHGASVGEIRAGLVLAARLEGEGERVVLSTTTASGRALARRLRPELGCALAPLDHPWCAERALARVRPGALVLVETELWPAWIRAARRRGVPVLVASGRISERTYPRYRRLAPLLRPTLRRLAAVGARSAADAERFRALGVPAERVEVTGDLKLEPPPAPPPLEGALDAALGATPLLAAGSTHPGEEGAALGALEAAERAGVPAALLLAPRRSERAAEVAEHVRARGRTLRLRSRLEARPLAPGEVLLLDGLGELAAVWPRARLAFVGGSLAPVGGHNVLEPLRAGVPVLFGPHTGSAPGAAELALASGAAERVADAAALARAAARWLADPEGSRAAGERGRAALEAHRGAATRTAALVARVRDAAGAGKDAA